MKNPASVLLIALFLLSACGTRPTRSEPTSTLTLTLTPSAVFLPSATPTPEPPDLSDLPIEEAARMFLAGEAAYPLEFDDAQRAAFAVAIATEINQNAASEVYADTRIGRVCWDPAETRWRVFDNPKPEDCRGDSLPPLIIAGYTNTAGEEIHIDPETGAEILLTKIAMPTLGELSLADLYRLGQPELSSLVSGFVQNATPLIESDRSLREVQAIQAITLPLLANGDYALFPVVIRKRVNQKKGLIYSTFNANDPTILALDTNSVLMPLIDPNSNLVYAWLNIHHGGQSSGSVSFAFSTDGVVLFSNQISRRFGQDASHSVGFLMHGRDPKLDYSPAYSQFLEGGEGVANSIDLIRISKAARITDVIRILKDFRLAVSSPYFVFYQTDN